MPKAPDGARLWHPAPCATRDVASVAPALLRVALYRYHPGVPRKQKMTSALSIRVASTLLLIAAGAAGSEADTGAHQDFVCISGPSRRVVSVFNLDAADGVQRHGGCRVDYNKDGETKTVYTSKTGRAFCAAKAALLVTNLSKGNYSCRAETLEQPEDAEPPVPPEPPAAALR